MLVRVQPPVHFNEQLCAVLAGPSYAPPMTTNKPPTLADAFAEEDAKATQAFQATQTPGTPEYAREQARLAAERDRVVGAGAIVLIRPYRPSELRAALPPAEAI